MAQILFKEFLLIRLIYTYFLVDIGPLVGGAVQQSFNDKAGVDDAFDQLLALDPRKFDFMKQKQRCPLLYTKGCGSNVHNKLIFLGSE